MTSVDVSLHLWGINLDPEMITKALNMKPTRSQKTGDKIKSASGKVRIAKVGLWELTSSENVRSTCMHDHLTWIIQQLVESPTNPSTLETVEQAQIDIYISGGDVEATTEFEVDSLVLGQLAALGLPLHFTVY